MRVLGLGDGWNAGAALVIDDRLVAASGQDRCDGQPSSRAFPWEAALRVLGAAGLTPADVDVVAIAGRYTPPFAARKRPALLELIRDPFSPALTVGTAWQEMLRGTGLGALDADRTAEWFEARLRERGYAPARVVLHDLHRCLAAAAYRTQPDDAACVVVVHPRGDGAFASVHEGRAGQLDRVEQQRSTPSVHGFYDRCLASMGLDPTLDRARFEGRAARGEPDPALVDALARVFRSREGAFVGRTVPHPELKSRRPWSLLAAAAPETAAASVADHLRREVGAYVRGVVAARGASVLAVAGGLLEDPVLVADLAASGVARVWAGPFTGASAAAVGAAVTTAGIPPTIPVLDGFPAERVTDRGTAANAARVAAVLARGGAVLRYDGAEAPGMHGAGTRSVLVRADDRAAIERARGALGRVDEEPLYLALPGALRLTDAEPLAGPLRFGTVAPSGPGFGVRGRVGWIEERSLREIVEHLDRVSGCAAVAVLPLGLGSDPPASRAADASRVFESSGLDALVLGDRMLERP